MSWTESQRSYFFGERVAEAQQDEDVSDEEFLQRYCSDRTRQELDRGNISPRAARRVVEALSRLAPSADHTSPGWSTPTTLRPVVRLGRARLYNKGTPPTPNALRINGPSFGFCAHEGHLHLWAEQEDIEKSGLFAVQVDGHRAWTRWNGRMRRHEAALDIEAPWDRALLCFIQYLNQQLPSIDVRGRVALSEILRPCRVSIGDPDQWDVIYPRLAAELGGDERDAEASDPVPEERPPQRGASTPVPSTGSGQAASGSSRESMLQVLRDVAISRVQTAIRGFNEQDLDQWVMSTGYADAPAPHEDCGDLLYVYAASLTNAGGAKPDPEGFGTLIRAAYQEAGLLAEHARDSLEPNLPDKRSLAQACRPHLQHVSLGGGFAQDIEAIAKGGAGRVLISGLLESVLRFSQWLLAHYRGSARALHADLTRAGGTDQSSSAFSLLRGLDQLPWMGVATAANFCKDSQVPGLSSQGLDPREAKYVAAGWFAKPDLHVARLLAYLTGRCKPGIRPDSLRSGQALAQFRDPPADNFSGDYSTLSDSDGLEMRIIADIHEWADCVGTSPLEIDRVLYLIGVRNTTVNGMTVSVPWYSSFVEAIDIALSRGVPRKS